MKLVESLVAAALVFASAACPAARYVTGRFASWVPYSDMPHAAAAALNQARSPVVLYDPQSARGMPDALFNFLLLREEYVAIAAKQLLMLRLAPKAWSERRSQPYAVIDERLVYDHVRIQGGQGPLAFDCLAYDSLGTAERDAFYRWAHAATATGKHLTMKAGRAFSRQDLLYVASDACADYHLAVRAKLGINSVLGGAETVVREPDEAVSPQEK